MDILESLRIIKFFVVENFSIIFFYNGVLIFESECEVFYFKEKLEVFERYIWKVYVNVVNIIDDKILLLILLVKVIVEIYG